MRPRLALQEVGYGVFGDTKFGGEFVLSGSIAGVPMTNVYHLLLSELRSVVDSPAAIFAPFREHVSHVVRVRAKKQMIGIDARRVVAPVQNIEPIGGRSIGEFPCEAVRKIISMIVSCLAVSIGCFSALPFPAAVMGALVYPLPESIATGLFAGIVFCAEAVGLSSVYSRARRALSGDTGCLSASALALAVRITQSVFGYPRGVVFKFLREMGFGLILLHVISSFQLVDQSPGRVQRRWALSIGFTPASIAQLGQNGNRYNLVHAPDLPFTHLDQRQRFTLIPNYWESENHNRDYFMRKHGAA